MPSKVIVIDIDLGIDLNQIITECAQKLTQEAQEELDSSIEMVVAAKKEHDDKKQAIVNKKSGVSAFIDNIYDQLVSAGTAGISSDSIMEQAGDQIANASAFSNRMNKFLSTKGNPYRMVRTKMSGEWYYIFMPFNSEK